MKVTVNGVTLDLPPGTSAIDAVFQAGFDVPYFCSHEYMSPIGACRMCLAHVGAPRKDRATNDWIVDSETGEPKIFWFPNPMATCTTAIMEGMVIDSVGEIATKAQQGMMEMHLINHPLDCPTCDKGGACELQDRAYEYGEGVTRFVFDKRHQEKHHALSELVTLDRERCIHCKRCVRYFEEVPGDEVLDFIERGGHTYIGSLEGGLPSNFSGNITDICPVGALLDSTSRFRGRNWEYHHTRSISPNDASGAAITIDARTGRIERIKAALNTQVNKVWIDDGTRFGHEYANSEARITTPLIRKEGELQPATWEEAGAFIAKKLQGLSGSDIAIALRADATLEEATGAIELARHLGTTWEHYPRPAMPAVPRSTQATFNDVATSDCLLIFGDVTEELPILDLRIKDALKGVSPPELMAHGVPIADLRLKERMQRRTEILSVAAPYYVDLMNHAGRQIIYGAGKELDAIKNLPQTLLDELDAAENPVIVLGGFILNNPEAAQQLYQLSERIGAKVMAIGSMMNSYGLDMLQLTDGLPDAEYLDVIASKRALIVSGLDPKQHPQTKAYDLLVVHAAFHTESTAHADVVLPAKTAFEKEGTVRNVEGRYLQLGAAPVSNGLAEDFTAVVKVVGEALGVRLAGRSVRSARRALQQQLGFELADIGPEGHSPEAEGKPAGPLPHAALDRGEVLLVPSMVKPHWASYNPKLTQAFGGVWLRIHPSDAETKALSTGDQVTLTVSGVTRHAVVSVTPHAPEGLMLLPATFDQPAGLATLESLELTRIPLEVA